MRGRRSRRRSAVALAVLSSSRRALGRIARRASLRRVAHGGLLGRVARRARVDGRQRARGPAVLLLGRTEAAGRGIGIRGRAAQGVLLVHGERGAARIRSLGR